MKACSKCKEIKPLTEFYEDKRCLSGKQSQCKDCFKEKTKKYYNLNKEKIKDISKQWYESHKDKVLISSKLWQQNNREKVNEKLRKWRKNNPEKVKEFHHIYYLANKERLIKEHISNQKKRYLSDPKFHLSQLIKAKIKSSLKGGHNKPHWEKITGHVLAEYEKQLSKTVPPGLTYKECLFDKNYHIDHIIPVSVFNFKTENDRFQKIQTDSGRRRGLYICGYSPHSGARRHGTTSKPHGIRGICNHHHA